ncbi:hypothetical protein V1506DRAFT_446606, partial [Lipomyces tetrasporus]
FLLGHRKCLRPSPQDIESVYSISFKRIRCSYILPFPPCRCSGIVLVVSDDRDPELATRTEFGSWITVRY